MILRDRDRTVDPFCENVVGLTFGQPSFTIISSISTLMAEAHQREFRDDQDR